MLYVLLLFICKVCRSQTPRAALNISFYFCLQPDDAYVLQHYSFRCVVVRDKLCI